MKTPIPLFKVYMSKTAKEEVGKVLDCGYIGQGPKVDEFENKLKDRFKTDYVLTTNAGTSAEHLALHLLKKPYGYDFPTNKHSNWAGIDDGDEVLATPLTCLYRESTVLLPDGTTPPINKLVNEKYSGLVVSYNEKTKKFENKKVNGWYKSDLGERNFIRLNYHHSILKNKNKKGTWVTNDHKILTKNRGWVMSGDLIDGELVLTDNFKLNESQEKALFGMLLGDGGIRISKTSKQKTTARYNLSHSYIQEEFGDIKSKILNCFNIKKTPKNPYKKSKKSFSWITKMSPYLFDVYERFYKNGKKIIPNDFCSNDLSELGLAIWFLDDGSFHKKQEYSLLCTDCFSKKDVERLSNIIQEKFNIKSTFNNKKNRLFFNKTETKKLLDIIGDYITPSMYYKFNENVVKDFEYNEKLWDVGNPEIYFDKVSIIKNEQPKTTKSKLKSVYCIDVENNHNFVSGGLIVHNCTASNFPILANNLKIKWVDVDPKTLNMDLDDLARKITPTTKAIMAVHWGGYPIDLDKLRDIQHQAYEKFGFKPAIIEDCAHSFGSNFNGQPIGSHGNICTFSFQAIKHLTSVDGGALILPHQKLYDRGRLLRWYGIDRETNKKDFRCESDISEWGFKFHMNDVNASIGLANLKEVNENVIKIHKSNGQFYDKELQGIDGVTLTERDPRMDSSYWIYSMLVDKKQDFMDYMKKCGIIVSQVHERNDIHSTVREFKTILPNLDKITPKLISIPVGWWVTEEERQYIVDCIKKGW